MATSPLQAALKPVGATESSSADEAYSTAMQQLMSTLEARQNRGSSNTLLAIAEGLLSPTPTGSFGEGLGQAAKAVRGVQAQQEKEQMDLAQMRLQLAQGQREQAQLAAAQQAFRQKSGLVPTQGAAGQAAGQPTGQTSDMKTVSLNDALEFIAAFPNQKELGARMMEAAKTGLDRYSMSMNGIVFDKFAGKYLNVDIPGQKQEPYDTAYGKFNMTPNEYARFDMAQKIGMGGEWMNSFKRGDHFKVDQIVAQKMEGKPTATPAIGASQTTTKPQSAQSNTEEYDRLRRIVATFNTPEHKKKWMEGFNAPEEDFEKEKKYYEDKLKNAAKSLGITQPPSLEEKPKEKPRGRLTVSQQEAEAAALKVESEVTAKSSAERTNSIFNAAVTAPGKIQNANSIQDLLAQEGMKDATGVLEKPGLVPALLKAVEEGVNLGRGLGISVPQVREIFTNNKINLPKYKDETKQQYEERVEAVISRVQQIMSLSAENLFGLRDLAKGQGALSNLENNIFASIAPSIRDTWQTLIAKTNHSKARAEVDIKLADAMQELGMSFDKFRRTDEFKEIQAEYDKKLRSIYAGVQLPNAPSAAPKQGAPKFKIISVTKPGE
jgi:hypothetical protein